MSLESFYGGKQGLSSVIKQAFKYISENDPYFTALSPERQQEAKANKEVMETCFQDINYETVWYGELCIIDTNNKNNPANGCLFRRTLAGQGSEYPIQIYRSSDATYIGTNLGKLSAEYIGQICGPRSGVPYTSVGTLEMVTTEAQKAIEPGSSVAYQLDISTDQEPDKWTMVYNHQLQGNEQIYEHNATAENTFISGRDTDEIKYNWVNIRKGDDTEGWVYIGFQIPYLEVDWTFKNTDFYVTPTKTNEASDRIFYQNWAIDIPRGVRGNAASKIKLTTLRQTPTVYQDFAQTIKQGITTVDDKESSYFYINTAAAKVDETFIKNENSYSASIDDSFNYRDVPFFVYEYTIYNDFNSNGTAAGETVAIYMGKKKDIKNFTLSANGIVTAHYDNLTKQQVNPSNPIYWVDNVTMVPANAAENAGVLTVHYNNSAKSDLVVNLALMKAMSFDAGDGKFTVTRTDGTTFEVGGDIIEYPHTIELLGDIASDGSDEDDDRDIKVTSNLDDAVPQSLGSPINYIQDIIVTADMHLCVLYNDKNHRTPNANFDSWMPGGPTSSGQADDDGNYWRLGITGSNGNTYGNLVYWRDYGRTTEYHEGLIFGYHLELIRGEDSSTYSYDFNDGVHQPAVINAGDKAAIINDILNVKWPNGLPVLQSPIFEGDITIPGNEGYLDMRGMLVTAVMQDANAINITYYFGYDYEHNVWECIQESASANQVDAVINDDKLEYVFSPSNEGVTFNINEVEDITMQGTLPAPWITEGVYEVADDPEPEPEPEPEPDPSEDNSEEEPDNTL